VNTNLGLLDNFKVGADNTTSTYIQKYLKDDDEVLIRKYYTNGLSRLINEIKVEIVSDIDRCKSLWNQFSPDESVFDNWDLRMAFHEAYGYTPYFLVVRNKYETLGVLPLDWDQAEDEYMWFGGDWLEDQKFFVTNPNYIPLLLFLAPKPIVLDAIVPETVSGIKHEVDMGISPSKFVLDLRKYESIESYIQSLSKKKRHNLRRDVARNAKLDPKILTGHKDDFYTSNQIIQKRSQEWGELPDFAEDEYIIKAFENVLSLKKETGIKLRMFSVYIDGVCGATDVNLIYKNTYYTLRGGYDVNKFPGIGNYIFAKEIEDAISLGMEKIDFLQIDYGWKHKWFEEVPLLKFSKK